MADTKRALVLGGGGARGSFQVGMLEELIVNQGIDFQIIRGVSVGALNAAFLAQAPVTDSLVELKRKVSELKKLWTSEIRGNKSVYSDRGGFLSVAAGADSIYSLEPLKRLIHRHVSLKALRTSGRNFAVGTVSLPKGRYIEYAPQAKNFIDKLIASASIPVVFSYINFKSEKEVLVDGGVRNITPLSSAFAAQPDEMYILLTSRLIRSGGELPDSGVQKQRYDQWDDNWLGTKVSGITVLKRTIEILTDEIYLDDIRGALHWNEVAEAITAVEKKTRGRVFDKKTNKVLADLSSALKRVKKRPVPLYILAPREWYWKNNQEDKNSSIEFSPALIDGAIEHGKKIASNPHLWLWPPV